MKKQFTKIVPFTKDGDDYVGQDSNGRPMLRVMSSSLASGTSSFGNSINITGLIWLGKDDAELVADIIDEMGRDLNATTFLHKYQPEAAELGLRMFVYEEHQVSATIPAENAGWQPLKSKFEGSTDLYDVTVGGISVWKRSTAAAFACDQAGNCEFEPFRVAKADRDPEPARQVKPLTKAEQKALEQAAKLAGANKRT